MNQRCYRKRVGGLSWLPLGSGWINDVTVQVPWVVVRAGIVERCRAREVVCLGWLREGADIVTCLISPLTIAIIMASSAWTVGFQRTTTSEAA